VKVHIKPVSYEHKGCLPMKVIVCSTLHMFLNIFIADQLELYMHVSIHKNQKVDLKCTNSSFAIDFNFIKEIRK
jgi:hypothetical protein